MIYVGIDDTDTAETRGTNQLARALAARIAGRYRCKLIVRHQLLEDPRVPCTSKNGAASMLLEPSGRAAIEPLIGQLRTGIREWFVEGSDPGLCVATAVPPAVRAFGTRCQQELVTQEDARWLAARHDVHLEGFGGTEDGVVGALAAVGLVADGDDGRIVQIGDWPDDLAGWQDVPTLHARGVEVRSMATWKIVTEGRVDVGKHLRPNYRQDNIVLFVEPERTDPSGSIAWRAVRFT